MQLFYSTQINENIITLSEEESKHCINVLRFEIGDTLHITDGKGNLFESRLLRSEKRNCLAEIISVKKEFGKKGYRIHIAIAPTKQNERFEWFLEKTVELGVDEITPIICSHSERKIVNMERMNKVIHSAMKQSLKAYLPKLNEPSPVNSFIIQSVDTLKCICSIHAEPASSIHTNYLSGKDITLLIGPEGDFTKEEELLAMQIGFKAISLGKSRLRTETAGVVACSQVHFVNND